MLGIRDAKSGSAAAHHAREKVLEPPGVFSEATSTSLLR